jgi:hypothetical protein
VKRVLFCLSLPVKPGYRLGRKKAAENRIWTLGGYLDIAGGTMEPTN